MLNTEVLWFSLTPNHLTILADNITGSWGKSYLRLLGQLPCSIEYRRSPIPYPFHKVLFDKELEVVSKGPFAGLRKELLNVLQTAIAGLPDLLHDCRLPHSGIIADSIFPFILRLSPCRLGNRPKEILFTHRRSCRKDIRKV